MDDLHYMLSCHRSREILAADFVYIVIDDL
jgi:hypothetical protein